MCSLLSLDARNNIVQGRIFLAVAKQRQRGATQKNRPKRNLLGVGGNWDVPFCRIPGYDRQVPLLKMFATTNLL